jgi:hypothetical protein
LPAHQGGRFLVAAFSSNRAESGVDQPSTCHCARTRPFAEPSDRTSTTRGCRKRQVLPSSSVSNRLAPVGKLPASQQPFAIDGIEIYQHEAGRVVAGWMAWDLVSMLQALGAIPGPAPMA